MITHTLYPLYLLYTADVLNVVYRTSMRYVVWSFMCLCSSTSNQCCCSAQVTKVVLFWKNILKYIYLDTLEALKISDTRHHSFKLSVIQLSEFTKSWSKCLHIVATFFLHSPALPMSTDIRSSVTELGDRAVHKPMSKLPTVTPSFTFFPVAVLIYWCLLESHFSYLVPGGSAKSIFSPLYITSLPFLALLPHSYPWWVANVTTCFIYSSLQYTFVATAMFMATVEAKHILYSYVPPGKAGLCKRASTS